MDVDHGLYDSRSSTSAGCRSLNKFQIIKRVVFYFRAVLKVLELREDEQKVSLMIAI